MGSDELLAKAKRWIEDDVDPSTRAELRGLLSAPDPTKTDLADRFAGSLEFGTAGLRGVLGAGPNRMNRAVVIRTTHGLAEHLLRAQRAVSERGVVVGYDGRRCSREFAEDTALVLAAAGIRAHLYTHTVPTPLVAFAVKEVGAAAGVMVTASHNPPEYNGYKVYWENAAQIIAPTDGAIARAIDQAPAACAVDRLAMSDARARKLVVDVENRVEAAYLDRVHALSVHGDGDRSFAIVYTPMHGVGDDLARRALARAGFAHVTSVPEQQHPDGAFPTVAFPNPEEKGAMDLAFALGRKLGADLILANDPDADRLAVAVPGETPSGYVQLTGNQLGILLGHYLLTENAEGSNEKRAVIASIVSSPMLGVIARTHGVRYEETLTGFKWIANRAMDLEQEGYRFVFGYEEALGYTVGDVVRDKDGISAAVLTAEMASVLRAQNLSLLDQLDALAKRYGLFVSSQVNLVKKGASGATQIAELMNRLRAKNPARIGEHAVESVADYAAQVRTSPDGAQEPLTLPKSNVLAFELKGGSRIIARPSGTEPKVKFYFDVCERVVEGEAVRHAEERATRAMKALADVFVALAES
jgi:phosphomannomutase